MPHLWSILRQKPARAVAQTGLRASATLPTSGTTSLDNSEGASQAVAELLDTLDSALAQISTEGGSLHPFFYLLSPIQLITSR